MSTITVHKCDQCGKEERGPMRYYELATYMALASMFSGAPPPATFCCWACLAAYVTAKAEKAKA